MTNENRFTKVEITPAENGRLVVAVTKQFAPEYGGGYQTFREDAGSWHHALDVARSMVTCSAAVRTDLPPAREWVTRDDYENIVEDGISSDMNAGGPDVDRTGRTRRQYVESYLRPQYRIIGEDR